MHQTTKNCSLPTRRGEVRVSPHDQALVTMNPGTAFYSSTARKVSNSRRFLACSWPSSQAWFFPVSARSVSSSTSRNTSRWNRKQLYQQFRSFYSSAFPLIWYRAYSVATYSRGLEGGNRSLLVSFSASPAPSVYHLQDKQSTRTSISAFVWFI